MWKGGVQSKPELLKARGCTKYDSLLERRGLLFPPPSKKSSLRWRLSNCPLSDQLQLFAQFTCFICFVCFFPLPLVRQGPIFRICFVFKILKPPDTSDTNVRCNVGCKYSHGTYRFHSNGGRVRLTAKS